MSALASGMALHAGEEADSAQAGVAASRSEQLDRLGRALEQLPDDERLAVHLYYLDADPVVAAVECLGVSRSGFYKLLGRARERLQTLLAGSQS